MIVQRITGSSWPSWVCAFLGHEARVCCHDVGDMRVQVCETDEAAMIEVVLPHAHELASAAFEHSVLGAYRQVQDELTARAPLAPARWWNHIPSIRRTAEDGRDWYMLFNAARHRAYERWSSLLHVDRQPPASTGLDTRTGALVVQLLATSMPAHPIQNPLQTPASQYSQRFGPLPPHFARATQLTGRDRRLLLISGTSSVIGEESIHPGDLRSQLKVTLANIERVVIEANSLDPVAISKQEFRIDQARAYVKRESDCTIVAEAVALALRGLVRLEIVEADLCRSDLLIEIEAKAERV